MVSTCYNKGRWNCWSIRGIALNFLLIGIVIQIGLFHHLKDHLENNNNDNNNTSNNIIIKKEQLKQQQYIIQNNKRLKQYQQKHNNNDATTMMMTKRGSRKKSKGTATEFLMMKRYKLSADDELSSDVNCSSRHVVFNQIKIGGRQPTLNSNATMTTGTSNNITTTTTTTTSKLRILCFVMTHSGNHKTRVKAIVETWGKRCDKLVIASNVSDPSIGAIKMNSDASYLGLWNKLNETLQYLSYTYNNNNTNAILYEDESNNNTNNDNYEPSSYYDWVFKADDDTYAIIENLREYLSSTEVQIKHQQKEPLIYGRRYSSPRYRNLENRDVYFGNPTNKQFKEKFYNKMNRHKPVIYNYGGAGYVMNWYYIQKFIKIQNGLDTISGTSNPPEDQCMGVVMGYHDIWPQKTRDIFNRERFHQEPPTFMYSMEDKYAKLWNDNHKATGGIITGPGCCSSQSITFHHLDPYNIRRLDKLFYECRGLE